MKLSKKEREIIRQHPRNLNNFDSCLKTFPKVNDKYNLKMIHCIEFLIELYVHNCTISFDKSLKKVQEKFLVTEEEIVEYLKNALLFPYQHTQNLALQIDKNIFNHSYYTLEEAQEGLKEYLNNPNMLLRHLAYFASMHSHSIENFLNITLKLPKTNDLFIISSDSIQLLFLCSELTLDILSRILMYRLGIPLDSIKDCLNLPVCAYFNPKIQIFLMERLDVKKEDKFFDLYRKKAAFMRSVNFLS